MAARQVCQVLYGIADWLWRGGGWLLFAVFLRANRYLFKRLRGYFTKATSPCAVAYGYARIRRLVRPGAPR